MRVLVLGGGYAGVVAVSRLERRLPDDVELLLVDERESHLIRHELHRVIRRPEFAETIQIPFDRILGRTEHLRGTVTGIDTDESRVTVDGQGTLDYDAALLSFGAGPAYYDLDGVQANSIPLDSPEDALDIGTRMEDLLAAGDGRVVVGGGGLAGIQAAGELAALREQWADSEVAITLLEQAPRLAPQFEDGFDGRLQTALEELCVEVRTGSQVVSATEDGVELAGGNSLEADLFVWTGGIAGRRATSGQRPRVRADLRLDGTTFAAGDAVSVIDVDGSPAPPSAQTAIRQAKVASTNIEKTVSARMNGESFRPRYDRYRDESFAWVVSVGDTTMAKIGPQVVSGQAAKAIKSTVGVGYLSSAGAIREAISIAREEFGFPMPALESMPIDA
jgi:NADH dehydrogenase